MREFPDIMSSFRNQRLDSMSNDTHAIETPSGIRLNRRFSVAPMMDFTDRYCRLFHRLLSKHAVLYTEMITTGALIYGDTRRHLHYDKAEHPIALQLGGSDPEALSQSVKLANDYGYDEVNLNCGCPSDRVQSGNFGAALMKDAPITIKHRIGIDDDESYQFLSDFVGTIADAGCQTFIIHARKAWLTGLSPKENREIPPLNYEYVYQLKRDFPDLEVILNGGIKTLEHALDILRHVDGVMMGREAYQNPYLLSDVDQKIYQSKRPQITRKEVIRQFAQTLENELSSGVKLSHMTRHLLGLYKGVPGGRKFRQHISENAHYPNAGIDILFEALNHVMPQ
jgi:tRNA-dihydrouridine synthase A